MVETISERAGDARLAAAFARLLRRLAALLARTDHDETSRTATDRGLAWGAEFARTLHAHELSRWLIGLRASGARAPDRAPSAWCVVGAPFCLSLASALEGSGLAASIGDDSGDWEVRLARIAAEDERDFAPPPEPPAAPSRSSRPASRSSRAPRKSRATGSPETSDLAHVARGAGIGPRIAEGLRIGMPARELALLLASLAEWIGTHGLYATRASGRIEIAGTVPADAPLPETLLAIAEATGASASLEPRIAGRSESAARAWWVRLPLADAPHFLFAEQEGRRIAIPWHHVVAYGLVEGADRPRVVLGRGFERIELPLDWLHGKGEGYPQEGEAGVEVLDAEGHTHTILVPESPAPVSAAPTAAPDGPSVPLETLQGLAVPADIEARSETPERGVVALVADDSLTARVFLARQLGQLGIEVDEAEDLPAAQARLGTRPYDVAFLDAAMPGGGALAIPQHARPDWPERTVVLVKDDNERRQAEALGFSHVLYKPFAEDEVAAVVLALTQGARPGVP
ncbi:MAG: response regulator [Candidatus Eiseniibacteriota bacterium]